MAGKRRDDWLDNDLRVALATGAVGWRERTSSYTVPEYAVLGVLGTSAIAVASLLFVSAGLDTSGVTVHGAGRWLSALAGTVAVAIAVLPSLAWPLGWRPSRIPSVRVLAAARVLAAMVVVGSFTALLGPAAPLPAWPVGAVIGAEISLTAWSLGVTVAALRWWWGFQRSPIHAGIVAAGAAMVGRWPDLWLPALRVWLLFQVIALATAVSCYALEWLRRTIVDLDREIRHQAMSTIHRRLSNWVHDEVTSRLRLLRFRVVTGDLAPEDVSAELLSFDHELRLLQLDQVLQSGPVHLAEILQPYVRLAQDHGIEVTDVPRFDEAAQPVDPEAGRMVRRVLAVLVPNVIAAGARQLAFRLAREQGAIAVELEDDAGGFDLDAVPAGRGLDSLRRELGPGRLTCTRASKGAAVRAVVTLDESSELVG